MTTIRFTVWGEPATQGSKRSVPIYNSSGPVLKNGRVMTRVIDDNPRLKDWRLGVANAAMNVYRGQILTGPIWVAMSFCRVRPMGHYGSGRNSAILKATAPLYPTAKPDVLKLARAVEDSLTGVLYRDDSQVVGEVLTKRYGSHAGCIVVISDCESEWLRSVDTLTKGERDGAEACGAGIERTEPRPF